MKIELIDYANRISRKYFQLSIRKNRTSFNVVWRGAYYFDLLEKQDDIFILTNYGKRFRDNINSIEITDNIKRIDLSLEQRRVLLRVY